MKPMTDLMCELENILSCHAQRYPLMQPKDAVKLIYQNEFGGGHLIKDEQTFLNYLRAEYSSIKKDPFVPLYEEVGNGIVRVNLSAVHETDLERLCKSFIHSAAAHNGTLHSFKAKLAVLYKVTQSGMFSFGMAELQTYLSEYEQAGYPMVSHSPEYREAYSPAYRIICKKYQL